MVSGVDRLSFTIRSNSVQSRLIVANGAGKMGRNVNSIGTNVGMYKTRNGNAK